ncbi:hypothetical protein FKP32DRAFT_1592395 [Trametes sanguinea]|nr:hypothetical protein FKP32DRAFT_1592395 [Trametes sanguinea]
MAPTTAPTAAAAAHYSQRATAHFSPQGDCFVRGYSSSTAAVPQSTYILNQRVLVQHTAGTWVPGTIISGPFFSMLLLTQAFDIEFFDAAGKRTRRCFRARDVRPAN